MRAAHLKTVVSYVRCGKLLLRLTRTVSRSGRSNWGVVKWA